MIAPETLLKLYPIEALKLQIQSVLKYPLKASHLHIGKPTVVSGIKTQVEVTLDKTKAPLQLWDRMGTVSFYYDRIDMDAFTMGIKREVNATFPTSPHALFSALLQPFSIPVAKDDVIDAIYTGPSTTSLLAAADSYRWIGEIDCTIFQLGLEGDALFKVRNFTPSFNPQFYSAAIKDILAFSLNVSNGKGIPEPLTTGMFTLGTPSVNGPIQDRDNTVIDVIFAGLPYSGSIPVTYMRRGFESSYRYPVKISGAQLGNTRQLADVLTVQMGCTIVSSDLASNAFPTLAIGEKQLISVPIDHTSLAYVGEILVEYTRTT